MSRRLSEGGRVLHRPRSGRYFTLIEAVHGRPTFRASRLELGTSGYRRLAAAWRGGTQHAVVNLEGTAAAGR